MISMADKTRYFVVVLDNFQFNISASEVDIESGYFVFYNRRGEKCGFVPADMKPMIIASDTPVGVRIPYKLHER